MNAAMRWHAGSRRWPARLAALEAVIDLFIEITFIATFTQRFFAR
jgi:hypothetical protein